jgi:hypothetical protein
MYFRVPSAIFVDVSTIYLLQSRNRVEWEGDHEWWVRMDLEGDRDLL